MYSEMVVLFVVLVIICMVDLLRSQIIVNNPNECYLVVDLDCGFTINGVFFQ